MWKVRAGVQGSKRKFHTHIHLDYAKIEILSYIKKKNYLVLLLLLLLLLLLFTHIRPFFDMNPISLVRTNQIAKSTHM